MISFLANALICAHAAAATVNSIPLLNAIPTVPFVVDGSSAVPLHTISRIVVDPAFANATDSNGSTLIPPTLLQFAETFSQDLHAVFNLTTDVVVSEQHTAGDIFMTVDDTHGPFLDAARRPSSEGYFLAVSSAGITVEGASPLGAWWASRTILQLALLHRAGLPYGSTTDTPGWATRGMMLDVGRHFYPRAFLVEMCAYMSFFKQNTFHLHLSDNLWGNPRYTRDEYMALYARMRLWSDDAAVQGLDKHANESYTRADFDAIQTGCAARGVTVLPEIEAPGHALVMTQWKPQLAYGHDMSLLNISHPETIPAMQAVWGTFLNWFHCKVVSIGADEYEGPAADYYRFVNALAGFIGTRSGKHVRTWGMYPPGVQGRPTTPIFQNISVQHWAFFEDDAYADYIRNNYSVVNSNDDFYVVNKIGVYPNTIDIGKTFDGSPSRGFWRPNVFDQRNATRNPLPDNAYVLGAIAALWNDPGPNATVYLEAYYAWRRGIPALADKQWGGSLAQNKFDAVFGQLQPHVPGQNLDRAIPSTGPVIFNYTFDTFGASFNETAGLTKIRDTSPNGYDAVTDCSMSPPAIVNIALCSLTTPLQSKGRDYTLSLSLQVASLDGAINGTVNSTNATLVWGQDSALMLTPALAFFASGNYYGLSSDDVQPAFPLGEWVDLSIIGRGNQTFAEWTSASQPEPVRREFRGIVGLHGNGLQSVEMAIEAPLHAIGGSSSGWTGQVRGFSLLSVAS